MSVEIFFPVLTACFIGTGLFHAIARILESNLPFSAMFGDRRYYFLSFVHSWILEQQLNGQSEKKILKRIPQQVFAYEVYTCSAFLSRIKDDINVVKTIYCQAHFVKEYLAKSEFTKESYKQLLAEYEKANRNQDVTQMMKNIVTDNYKNKEEKLIPVFAQLHTRPFIPQTFSFNYSRGENESVVFSAAKAWDVIQNSCSPESFVDCMAAIKQIHPEMKIVKSKQALYHHQDKPLNRDIMNKIGEIISDI